MSLNQPSPQDAFVHGQVVNLVRTGQALTRPALEQLSGLGRKVVAQRVSQAIDAGLLEDGEYAPSSGGRAPRLLRFRAEAGHVFAGVVGASEITAAITTLDGTILADAHEAWDVARGPDETLGRLDALFAQLNRRLRVEPWVLGIGVPGPVDFTTGRLVAPPIMPGWDGCSVRAWFRERYETPVWVDNDVNLMALGEWHRGTPRDGRDLLYVKVGTGIGAALVSRGAVHRGDTGAAGDIGHIQVSDDPRVVCRCGLTGCLEAVAGGWALLRDLTARARSGDSPFLADRLSARGRLLPEDIADAVIAGDEAAREAGEGAARTVATTVASLVNFVNPGVLVVGGGVLRTGTTFVDILAEAVLRRGTRLATQRLVVRPASLGFTEGILGAGLLAVEQVFAPHALGLWMEDGSPVGHAVRLHQAAAPQGVDFGSFGAKVWN
jgi:predicted NBD/HSP70 family sugar kinase